MAHTSNVLNRPQLDPNRIAANTGALAINAALVLALLAPITRPIVEQVSRDPDIVIVTPVEPRRIEPRPVPITPETRRTPAPVDPAPRMDSVLPAIDPVIPDAAGEPFDPLPIDTGSASSEPDATPPVTPAGGARLEYISAPPPPYPRGALRARLMGTVMLEVLVGTDGLPMEVRIAQSSGHRELDQAARRQVLNRWRFKPATQNGQPIQALGLVPVDFRLES